MRNWISVKTKLPQPEEPVLITREPTEEQLSVDLENTLICLYAIDDDGNWYDFQTGENENTDLFTVTHWMPLPEPAKTKGE